MEEKRTGKYVYVKRFKKGPDFIYLQISIILVFISLIALLSIWLPTIFANQPLGG